MPVFEFSGNGPTSAIPGTRPKVAKWRTMKEATNRPQPDTIRARCTAPSHVITSIPTRSERPILIDLPSIRCLPFLRCDDDERRTRRTARATPAGRVPCAALPVAPGWGRAMNVIFARRFSPVVVMSGKNFSGVVLKNF